MSNSLRKNILIQQSIHFFIVGLLATLLQYFILWVLVKAEWYSAPTASGIGYVISASLNYVLNYRITFQSTAAHIRTIKRFIVMVTLGWALTYILMYVFVHSIHMYYFFAQVVTTGIIFVLNFLLSRYWVFKTHV